MIMRRKPMIRILIGVGIGAVLGFVYYKLVGCPTGTCPITRNPYSSTLYGALLGALVASGIK
jgi:gas vesicle protein